MWPHRSEVYGMWCSPSMGEKSLIAVASLESLEILEVAKNLVSEPKKIWSTKLKIRQALWDLEGLQNEIKLVSGNRIVNVSLERKAGAEVAANSVEAKAIISAALDPHHCSVCLAACGNDGIHLVDFRAKRASKVINSDFLHGFSSARGIDFNPTSPNQILSYGQDGQVLFHDIRFAARDVSLQPLSRLKAHEHAIGCALYNPFHSGLILSGGSDQCAKLWDTSDPSHPVVLRCLTDFGDTVVAACWSSNGPWAFAGISYNGKVLVDYVPNDKKMGILLGEKK